MNNKIVYVAVAAFALFGCSTVARFTATLPMPLSTIRSPITLKNFFWLPNGPIDAADRGILNCTAQLLVGDHNKSRDVAWNESHNNEFCKGSPLLHSDAFDPFDTFQDLCEPESEAPYSGTLLFVAISGGGARATALASHALAILEGKYNAYNHADQGASDFVPLIDRIAAVSTVSGGSIYAHHVAQAKTLLDDAQKALDNKKAERQQKFDWNLAIALGVLKSERTTFFDTTDSVVAPSIEDLGLVTGVNYFAPLTMILPLLSDINYLHLLSQGLSSSAAVGNYLWTKLLSNILETELATPIATNTLWDMIRRTYNPTEVKLSYLTPTPRFFFNATILERGFLLFLLSGSRIYL